MKITFNDITGPEIKLGHSQMDKSEIDMNVLVSLLLPPSYLISLPFCEPAFYSLQNTRGKHSFLKCLSSLFQVHTWKGYQVKPVSHFSFSPLCISFQRRDVGSVYL